eukprot:gene17176-18905_t
MSTEEDLRLFFLSVDNLVTFINENSSSSDFSLEYSVRKLEDAIRIFMGISLAITNVHGYYAVKDMMEGLINGLCTLLYDLNAHNTEQHGNSTAMETQTEQVSTGGRPRYVITRQQIECLRETGMSWRKIASSLGINERTLLRRRAEFNMLENFSDISDEDLDYHVSEILRLTPFAGESLIKGSLLGRGIFVPRQRVPSNPSSLVLHQDEMPRYGIDIDGPIQDIETDNNVVVPEINPQYSEEQLQFSLRHINPLRNDNNHGLSVFNEVQYILMNITNT